MATHQMIQMKTIFKPYDKMYKTRISKMRVYFFRSNYNVTLFYKLFHLLGCLIIKRHFNRQMTSLSTGSTGLC